MSNFFGKSRGSREIAKKPVRSRGTPFDVPGMGGLVVSNSAMMGSLSSTTPLLHSADSGPSSSLSQRSGDSNDQSPLRLTYHPTHISRKPAFTTSASFIYTANYKGHKAALKIIRPQRDEGEERASQRAKMEADIWGRLHHRNIAPLLEYGFCDLIPTATAGIMVYPWYKNGHSRDYIRRKQPGLDQRLALLLGVSHGLAYIHEKEVVHGDPKPDNILIDDHGTPLLADFGMSQVIGQYATKTAANAFNLPTPRYCAPELLNPDVVPLMVTKQSDVYALASVAVEFLFGIFPHRDVEDYAELIDVISRGEKPAVRPPSNTMTRLGQEIWSLLEWCWSINPPLRPSAERFAKSIAHFEESIPEVEVINEEDVPNLSSHIEDLGKRIFHGTYSEIFLGKYNGQKVAIKVLKEVWQDPATMLRKARRERETWWALVHPNILPLLGYVDGPKFGPCGALVSPWYERGNASDYLDKAKDLPATTKFSLWRDVSYAITFLHTRRPAIVHGDLKPANILIDDKGAARICDFGLVQQLKAGAVTSSPHTGTLRYLSPELLKSDGEMQPTMASDMWALGCVGLEVLYSRMPYDEVKGFLVASYIERGDPPARPPNTIASLSYISLLWDYFADCWNFEPLHRPSATTISRRLEQYGDLIAGELTQLHTR